MRRSFLLASVTVLALLAVGIAQQRQTLAPEPMKVEKVKDGLYVIRGPFNPCGTNGCNANNIASDDGLLHEPGDVAVRVTSDGLILIDDKYAVNVPDVLQRVKSVSTLPIKYLLNTHHHTDHAGGNGLIQDMGIEIIAHRNIRENFLRNKQPGPPRITFNDQESVFLGSTEVKMYYFGRGHTNGDTVIAFPDVKAIHTGDLIIDGMPVIDYNNGGSALEFPKTLKKILDLDFDTAIPGHGRVLTRQDVIDYIPKVEKMNERMKELVRRGVPKDQLEKQLKLDDLGWDHTVSTSTFMRSIGQYFDEVAAAR